MARDLMDFYKDQGYAGVVITDHYWAGNTRVDRYIQYRNSLPPYEIRNIRSLEKLYSK